MNQPESAYPAPTPLPFPLPNGWPPYWIAVGVAGQTVLAWTELERQVLPALSAEDQERLLRTRLDMLRARELLTEDELSILLAQVSGEEAAIPPPHQPDGSPNLCGILGGTIRPGVLETGTAGTAAAAAGGALLGAAIGGPMGAAVGAVIGVLAVR